MHHLPQFPLLLNLLIMAVFILAFRYIHLREEKEETDYQQYIDNDLYEHEDA